MRTFKPLTLLGTLGALAVAATAGAVDTSQWKCEYCPSPEKSRSATLEVGAGDVSDDSASFGNYTGLDSKGLYPILGGAASYRGDSGNYASLAAADLGLDTRSANAQVGKEGRYRLTLGYASLPRYFNEGAQTPFLGTGGSVLSLPAGFPAGTTATMPLDTALHAVEVGYKRSRFDAGLLWIFGSEWTTRVNVRHDVRDGTQRMAASFFSSSSQLPAPIDQTTDQFEVAASRYGKRLQFTVGYQGSLFRNGTDSFTWTNPFPAVVPGATQGQMALSPDNQFHQIMATVGLELTNAIHASGDIAAGRMTQDAAYVAATLNPNLAAPLPAGSLNGIAYTFNTNVRVTAALSERMRLNASYARDVRDNRTESLSYPAVSTDIFLGDTPRTNQAFGFINDRYRVSGEYRGHAGLRAAIGYDIDHRERTLQEVLSTNESTVWGRIAVQALNVVSLSAKYAHSERNSSTYGTASWVTPPENPLLRKYNLAERSRDKAGMRADIALGERVNLGFGADVSDDQYKETTLGLLDGRSISVDGDLAFALSENTQLHAFGQGERSRSHQTGSQLYAQPDWWASIEDNVNLIGAGAKHVTAGGKVELSADYVESRSNTDIIMNVITVTPQFPKARTALDTLKLQATYRFKDNWTIVGSYWFERYKSLDWHYDDMTPATVQNLLLFGDQPPYYNLSVYGLAVRCRF